MAIKALWKYGIGKMQYILSGEMREGCIPSRWGIWALKHNRILIGLEGPEGGRTLLFSLEDYEMLII